ncbi:hypothetical protein JTB14_031173 [Gonioctena quinquepunctata]|nr:hypothetical protein JTB14_031173 [Gonioctena quinquepunctata]
MASKTFLFSVMLLVLAVKIHKSEANDVDKLLRKLREEVDEALVKAQKVLDDAKAKINELAQKGENTARDAMRDTEQKLKEQLDVLKEKAKKAGVNIDSCLGEDENKLINLPNDFSDDMVHCVSDTINQGIGYAQDALNKIKKIVDDVENLKQEIKDCGHGFKAVKCFAKLAARIERETVSLPAQIEADAVATAALISQLDKKIEKCASDKTDAWESKGEALIEKIGLCVAAKIIL